MKGYSCQCITHVGCCIKRKPRENIKVCVNVLLTSYRQVTNTLPTVGQLSADCRPPGSQYFGQNLLAVCRPTVGRLSADRFFGELFFTITAFSTILIFHTSPFLITCIPLNIILQYNFYTCIYFCIFFFWIFGIWSVQIQVHVLVPETLTS